jgi:hypothetical protein
LLVGISADASIAAQGPGQRSSRPTGRGPRARAVSAMPSTRTRRANRRSILPDVLVKGGLGRDDIVGRAEVEAWGGGRVASARLVDQRHRCPGRRLAPPPPELRMIRLDLPGARFVPGDLKHISAAVSGAGHLTSVAPRLWLAALLPRARPPGRAGRRHRRRGGIIARTSLLRQGLRHQAAAAAAARRAVPRRLAAPADGGRASPEPGDGGRRWSSGEALLLRVPSPDASGRRARQASATRSIATASSPTSSAPGTAARTWSESVSDFAVAAASSTSSPRRALSLPHRNSGDVAEPAGVRSAQRRKARSPMRCCCRCCRSCLAPACASACAGSGRRCLVNDAEPAGQRGAPHQGHLPRHQSSSRLRRALVSVLDHLPGSPSPWSARGGGDRSRKAMPPRGSHRGIERGQAFPPPRPSRSLGWAGPARSGGAQPASLGAAGAGRRSTQPARHSGRIRTSCDLAAPRGRARRGRRPAHLGRGGRVKQC